VTAPFARRRGLATALACAALLLPRGVAYADDPEPTDWPQVEAPTGGGGESDPQPVEWPAPEPL
jgi:hypothetical protein